MRVYVPVTLAMLQQLVDDGSLRPVNGTAFAVTPTLREAYSEGGDDELADVALREAALASLRLIGFDSGETGEAATKELPARRAVLEADMEEGGVEQGVAGITLRPDLDDAVVRLAGEVRLNQVIAAYVDNAAAESAVLAAVEAIDAADLGDEDAELTVGDAQDHDLAWYAPQELQFLLDLL